jgi:hypothetical protein
LFVDEETLKRLAFSLLLLGIYLTAIGLLNMAGRPFVVAGSTDVLLLSIAVAGLVVSGGLGLIMEATPLYRLLRAAPWSPWGVYGVIVVIWAKLSSNQLVVYCISEQALAEALREAAHRLGQELQPTAHKNVFLLQPSLTVLRVRPFRALAAASLTVQGARPRTLKAALRSALKAEERSAVVPNWPLGGVAFTLAGTVLIAYPVVLLLVAYQDLVRQFLP